MKPHPPAGHDSGARSSSNERGQTTVLLLTMADTTWRIFTPVLLFTGFGIWLDLTIGTKPWLTFAGVIIGFILAAMLVKAQIKKVQQ